MKKKSNVHSSYERFVQPIHTDLLNDDKQVWL